MTNPRPTLQDRLAAARRRVFEQVVADPHASPEDLAEAERQLTLRPIEASEIRRLTPEQRTALREILATVVPPADAK